MTVMTLKEAARLVDKSEVTLRALARSGALGAKKGDDGIFRVDPNSVVEHFARSNRSRTSTVNRTGASTKSVQSSAPIDNQSDLVIALRSQISFLERELVSYKDLLRDEKEARNRLESDMTVVIREIRAVLDGQNQGVLSRFFKK